MTNSSQPLLPPLPDVLDSIRSLDPDPPSPLLTRALVGLFEASPVLDEVLYPELRQYLYDTKQEDLPGSYAEFVDSALHIIRVWDWENQAAFVCGHPRIGDVNGLSVLSAAEQGNSGQPSKSAIRAPTPPEVLARLAFLNAVYERRYPGLVYITFVNGRSRAQIKDEMEEKLESEGVLPAADDEYGLKNIVPQIVASDAWCKEVSRAVDDVGKIAKSRLDKLGII
ncbi:hypothetical protein EW145_g1118 [Phellinidium pouzarii]|uniref:Oxo-4-hydroxy-4-carboxy-5-ureidoimidazoline decarboxylase domain-containing protein n=1 Tax=Phellinidium pouzarii TaxID=167371 RepID=A0A4S4LFY4_9AGAM|nr:hypothetical protein EW145_g1118 [Phellinidium pouzarii]